MKRQMLFAAAVFVTLPALAGAQEQLRPVDHGWGPRVRATPFVGWSPGFNSAGLLAVFANNNIAPAEYSFDYAPGPVSGVGLEVRVHDRFSGIGSVAWSSRGHTRFDLEDGTFIQDAGSDFYIAKLGGQIRFREADPELQLRRLNASLYLAGAFLREDPEVSVLSSSRFVNARNHWGVNFGAEAELPLTDRRFAFITAFEDHVIFWDEVAIQERMQSFVLNSFGPDAAFEVDADHSHLWVLRLGLSYRFSPF